MRKLALVLIVAAGAAALAGCTQTSTGLQAQPGTAYVDARTVLYQAADDKDWTVRCNALESLGYNEGAAAGGALLQGLSDPYFPVRFAAAMAIGDARYAPAHARLRAMINAPDADNSLRCGLIYALHQLGDDTYTGRLGRLLFDADPVVRSNAALCMGKIGEPSAIQPLKSLLENERDLKVRSQVLESLIALGDDGSFGLVYADVRAGRPEQQVLAVQALGRSRNQRAKGLVQWALRPEHEPLVRVAAATALARMGDDMAYDLVATVIRDPQQPMKYYVDKATPDELQRYQTQLVALSALGLGQMGKVESVDLLLPLLKNPCGEIRVAAARSILQLLAAHRPAALTAGAATTAPARPSTFVPVVAPSAPPTGRTPVAPATPPTAAPATRPAAEPPLRRSDVLQRAPALD